jgi:uncharacterized protein (TIGR02646 family)
VNPFVYPKSPHTRTLKPRQYKRYQTYKRYLRLEFAGKCVYCQMPSSMREYAAFGVDHYRPQKLFPHLATTYSNLYYCCRACNTAKGAYWPATANLERTHFVPNPCDHAMFTHLRFRGAEVEGRTTAGKTAVEILDLNDPESVQFREFMIASIAMWEQKRSGFVALKAKVEKKLKSGALSLPNAQQAAQAIDAEIANADKWLKKLAGVPA